MNAQGKLAIALSTSISLTLFGGLTASSSVQAEQTRWPAVSNGGSQTPTPMSITASVQQLVSQMTLAEKVGQMTQVDISDLWAQNDSSRVDQAALEHLIAELHVGSVLNGGSDNPSPNTPGTWATQANAIQAFATQHTRLHIPILYGIDAVHGDGHIPGAAIFPQNLGMASTWDPALAQQEGVATATALRAMGVQWDFAPDLDVARDVRWGRYYETFGEDPFLASTFAAAAVTGMQGTNPNQLHIAATGKHFIGYSEPLTGQDRTEGQLPLGYLRQTFVPPFQTAINSGLAAVMAQSGSVNGIPVHASHYLLTDLLRSQLNFKGIVVSDWADIHNLYASYHVASSDLDAIRVAVNAGVDMAMVPYDADTFSADLMQLVQDKQVSMARINQAVTNILTVKEKLGLFQSAATNATRANATVYHTGWSAAERAADESLILLKNNGVLPFSSKLSSILVAGPSANSVANQMGGWTIGWQGMSAGGTDPGAVTVLKGIEQDTSKATKVYFNDGTNPSVAARMAKKASAAVVVVGESPYAETAGDTVSDTLPASQAELISKIEATGKPTVVVVLAGRPLIMTDTLTNSDAVLAGFLPGSMTGRAVADVVFGKVNPSGRLPVSWPTNIGEEPLFYDQLPGTNSTPPAPLFSFGYGLSYTHFMTGNPDVSVVVGRNETMSVKIGVMNAGSKSGTDVVQVYGWPDTSSVLAPVKRLIGFSRVWLKPGEHKTVSLKIPASRLALPAGDVLGNGPMTVAPGTYTLSVDGNTASIHLH